MKVERKNNPKVLSSAFNAIKNKYDDVRVSVDETGLAAALKASAPKGYLNSISTNKGWIKIGCK